MLDVFLHDVPVGHIRGGERGLLSFQYGEAALDQPAASRLSIRLPVRPEPYDHEATTVFFENLLPEGEGRDLIAQARHYSPGDVGGLLGMVGGECAGAVSLWPAGESPSAQPSYRTLSPAELAALFDPEYGARVTDMQIAERLSMSGAQQKMIFRRRGGTFELPLNGSPSNVIIKRAKPVFPGLVLNELACMRLLAACGFQAAVSEGVGGERLLFQSLRYDRVEQPDGTLRRLHQEDFCQVTGHRSGQKYQARGGPSHADLAQVIRRHCANPLRDLETLARWALFNLLVGNNDGHAKNLSLLYEPGGPALAPVYDVVSTHVYPQIDRELAIHVGGQKSVAGLHRGALEKFARSMKMGTSAVSRLGLELAERAEAELPGILHAIAAEHGHDAVLDQIHELVLDRAAWMKTWLTRTL
ncbi:MAG TPA: HipA domain-containing protein [Longimicrobium sp.]|jgi:serine/threonine-protein kinase HipA|uniref:HipA domain-containing protein n=1 Tax=Longimicrobium sp. TaxID=2029185 RepID=UPI002ED810CA